MRHRTFIGHDGRIHRVRKTEEEIREGRRYWTVFFGVCLLWGVVMALASGIFA